MKKRLTALLLTAAMTFGLAACAAPAAPAASTGSGNGESAPAEAEAPAAGGEEITKIVFTYPCNGTMPDEANIDRIEAAINEITREKIGVEIDYQLIASGSYQQQLTLMLSGNEQVDVSFLYARMIAAAVGSEQLRDLTPYLEEYGQDLKAEVGDLIKCGQFNGVQYCIPTQTEIVQGMGTFLFRTDLVEKYNIDLESIKTIEDVTNVFQLIHDNEPDLIVVNPNSAGYSFLGNFRDYDFLGDNFGVLMDWGQNLDVVNLFETESYLNTCNLIHDWYERGFISNDIVSDTEGGRAKMKAGKLFCVLNCYKPGIEAQEEMTTNTELSVVSVMPGIKFSNNSGNFVIPENSKNPEKAMQFINLLYTDSDLINLIAYGQEGIDYEVREDGRIGYPEGLDAATVGYSTMGMLWGIGNEFKSLVWETNAPDIWEQTKEFAKGDGEHNSKAYGFIFDPTPVANEIAAVTNAYSQYNMAIECGLLDPEPAIAEMNEALYAAGLQKIIDEKQAQLTAWAELNGVE